MSDAERQLYALALAANQHACEHHGQTISTKVANAIDRVGEILDRERSLGHSEFIESMTVCYGAWWGEYVREHFGGRWIGLSEPTAPRVRLGGSVYSPMDAVRRRLLDDSAPTLRALADRLRSARESTTAETIAVNQLAWDTKANDPRFTLSGGLPGSREEALAAIDPWLAGEGTLEGLRLLCLAAGGGTHGPLHALAGARVTVVDLSPKQLEHDRMMADEMGLSIERIVTSMDNLSMLSDDSFDAVIHPVSLCYVPEVAPVYHEISRVLRPGGLYISQQKQPSSLQASVSPVASRYVIEHPAEEGYALPALAQETTLRESGTQEFLHPLGTLLGSLCASGFVIEEIVEPPRGDVWAPSGNPQHRATYLPPYLKIKARRR
ncbi:bifunctional 3-demethylubiquinone-9 3-methyltransferase/ 2-octaprenyl-6-hydroxy phenol methylase [Novipirellula galeiformis]|uniref:Bifunctional 3-demethylubiquinone-9 3-methyltransferase/ 2-octaprenyl-6-hydroxy phenol methylase n=1 Tax=Novipirellula galeiformis TaxID=2528004 RepID=A0A5C6CKP2_9BACT|nr:class I SAM-dependent methyltransferase [Novipirellula galeiformis]TWU23399.1 bifunctional 3-demethylubiquinone-9 3-methyltransferase/ 2-octaprenyl-6-hydroxy phenol methylase [Novipirellula galeiformis]